MRTKIVAAALGIGAGVLVGTVASQAAIISVVTLIVYEIVVAAGV